MRFYRDDASGARVDSRAAALAFLRHAASHAGDAVAEVEVGDAYTDAERVLVSVGDYLEVLANTVPPACTGGGGGERESGHRGPVVYLAQQQLFDTAPALRRLCETPPYAAAGRGDAYATNCWIGPPGTVSPLHRDPTHNLLAQLYGEKRLTLFRDPSAAAASPLQLDDGLDSTAATATTAGRSDGSGGRQASLYPFPEPTRANTSMVDPELAPDEIKRRFPLFPPRPAHAPVVLRPGEVLFVPRGLWHHVRALPPPATPVASVSVNFFFD